MICPGWRVNDYRIDGLREQILKARQEGFSTIIAALLFINTYNQPNTNTVVIADNGPNTENLFRKVRTMYDNLPGDKRLPTDYAGKRNLSWPSLGSTYQVLTAGARAAGRSRTIHYLHMSERPFWDNADLLTGLLPTVPADGAVFDESTANGEGNEYHEDYKRARAGLSTFTARFYSWFENPEYSTPAPPAFEPIGPLSLPDLRERFGDEEGLQAKFALTADQLYWRRRKMMEPGQGPLFRQEYPSDEDEAFLVSGARFFENWNPDKHTCLPFDIPAHWKWICGYDWGYAAPCCLLIGAVDEQGGVYIVDEFYEPRLTNDEQADAVVRKMQQYGIPLGNLTAADQSMWSLKQQATGLGKADVEAFHAKGLGFVPAQKNEQHIWNNVRQYLHDDALKVFRGRCPNLIRTLPQMKHDPTKPERLAEHWEGKSVEDHAPATLGYLLGTRIRAALHVKTPAEQEADMEARWQEQQRQSSMHGLIGPGGIIGASDSGRRKV